MASSGGYSVHGKQTQPIHTHAVPHNKPPNPPVMYMQGYDILEDMYSPRTAAQNLLLIIAQKKRKAHLAPLMGHIAAALSAHDAAVREATAAGGLPAAPAAIARRMDGALLALGTCAETLKSKAPYNCNVETMLTQFVMPCFDSPHGHLRAKACWVAKEFCDFEFSDGGGESGRGALFCRLFERVMRGLADPDLPVRVDAVVALRSFVEALADLEILKPVLPSLLHNIFGLMAEVDNEDLVFTLEGIVEIGPYAVDMARQLTAAFWKYVAATEEDGDDDDADAGVQPVERKAFVRCCGLCRIGLLDDCRVGAEAHFAGLQTLAAAHVASADCGRPHSPANPSASTLSTTLDRPAAMSAYGCIRTLNALLDSVSTLTTLLPALEEIMFPIMYEMCSSRGQDVFEEVMDMASYFTYFMSPISPRLWTLWPRIQACVMDWGIDYWDNVLPPLDNLVSRDTSTFLHSTSPNYQESLYQVGFINCTARLGSSRKGPVQKDLEPNVCYLSITL